MKNCFSLGLKRRFASQIIFAAVIVWSSLSFISAQTGVQSADRALKSWRTYSPEDVNFKVSFPSDPTRQFVPTAFESLEGTKYQATTPYAMFQVIQINIPAEIEEETLKSRWSEMVKAGMLEVDNAYNGVVVLANVDVSKPGVMGRAITIEKGTIISSLRFYLANRKLYVVETTRPSLRGIPEQLVKVYQAEANKFFDSFQIVDNKKLVSLNKGR